MPSTKLVTKNSHTPNINHLVILISHHNLGGDIIQSATESFPFIPKIRKSILFPRVNRPTEISELHHIVHQHNILRLQIAMDYPIFVQVGERVNSLPDVVGGFSFREETLFSEDIE